MKNSIIIGLVFLSYIALAQDNYVTREELIKKYNLNKPKEKIDDKRYHFTDIVDVLHTPVKDQTGAATCWSYATNSFIESEMMRMGKRPYELSRIYSLRCALKEKADIYIRMHGGVAWGEGGECHDVINMYSLYGAIPQAVYPGKDMHITSYQIAEMIDALKAFLDRVIANPGSEIAHDWRQAFDAIMVTFIGDAPDKFNFDAHNYTPVGFARRSVCIHPEDYIELASYSNKPVYKKLMLMVPDNWSFNRVYNVKMDDLTEIIDRALSRGYTVAWDGDISEPYFNWQLGIAYVPEKEVDEMTDDEKIEMFDGPKFEKFISADLRQKAINNFETTDDHAMHIVGIAEDQNHKKYYKVKNSWDTNNEYNGYIYVTKNYVKYKTFTILLHKSALPIEIRNKLNLGTVREF